MALKRNDKSAEVMKLQQALIELGYELPRWGVDGSLGRETLGALARFLAAHSKTFDQDAETVSDEELAFVYSLQSVLKQEIPPPVQADKFFDMRVQAGNMNDYGERAWSE